MLERTNMQRQSALEIYKEFFSSLQLSSDQCVHMKMLAEVFKRTSLSYRAKSAELTQDYNWFVFTRARMFKKNYPRPRNEPIEWMIEKNAQRKHMMKSSLCLQQQPWINSQKFISPILGYN